MQQYIYSPTLLTYTLSSDSEDFHTNSPKEENKDSGEDLIFLPEEIEAIILAKGTPKHVRNKSDYYINDMEYYSSNPTLALPFK